MRIDKIGIRAMAYRIEDIFSKNNVNENNLREFIGKDLRDGKGIEYLSLNYRVYDFSSQAYNLIFYPEEYLKKPGPFGRGTSPFQIEF